MCFFCCCSLLTMPAPHIIGTCWRSTGTHNVRMRGNMAHVRSRSRKVLRPMSSRACCSFIPARAAQSHGYDVGCDPPVRRLHGLVDGPERQGCTIVTVQADGPTSPRSRAWPRMVISTTAGRLLGGARASVRLLHAWHDHVGGEPLTRTPSRPSAKSAKGSRATSFAARATSTSSRHPARCEQ